jgi:hypothetical protein
MSLHRLFAITALLASAVMTVVPASAEEGFTSLFNGNDFTNWKVPEGDGGHWRIVDGVIDYDGDSQAPGDKHVWSEKTYKDFTFRCEWRIKSTPYLNPRVPIIKMDGTHKLDADGKPITITVPDSDSGILLRGNMKSQINIWCWPCGSGEIYGYRMDQSMPPAVRAALVPKENADKNIGEWNQYEITVKGNRVTVVLNGVKVLDAAELPGLPETGPVGLQHHGNKNAKGEWTSPPALVQFRNIEIKELAQ